MVKKKSSTPTWARVVAIVLAIGLIVSTFAVIGGNISTHQPETQQISLDDIEIVTEKVTETTDEVSADESEAVDTPAEEESTEGNSDQEDQNLTEQ